MKSKIIKYGIIGYAAFLLFQTAKRGVLNYKNIQASIAGVRKIRLNQGRIEFLLDLVLINPTTQNFNINTGGLVVLREVSLFTEQGVYLATSYPQKSQLNLEASTTQTIRDIPAFMPIENISEALAQLGRFQTLKTKTIIEVAGQIFEI